MVDMMGPIDSQNAEHWRNLNYADLQEDFSASWAAEFSCLFPNASDMDLERNNHDSYSPVVEQLSISGPDLARTVSQLTSSAAEVSREIETQGPLPHNGQPAGLSVSPQAYDQDASHDEQSSEPDPESAQLIKRFLRIVQPPAAILIGGCKRWRRLQRYLCEASQRCCAVQNALHCVVGLLTIDETSSEAGNGREECLRRIHRSHQMACDSVKAKLALEGEPGPKTTEFLLAAVFLLAWFEVIHDQDDKNILFPRDLADSVISSKTTWTRVSQELLSWMNTLDSKAAHLGGDHLLPQHTIDLISHYQTQITSSSPDDPSGDCRRADSSRINSITGSISEGGSLESRPNLRTQKGQVKHALLSAILQPALQWYLTSQAYCRRISAFDMYHRRRVNTDDEYEIITACKQLESELSEHWNFRPTVISLTAEQLEHVVSPDLATRLEEVFNVYLSSFWALFVYLHRVSWWNLPHSRPHSVLVRRSLAEMWRTLQRAYGEVIEGTTKKVVHLSLLWPLFLFGSECVDLKQREWAIRQMEYLGEVKPVLEDEELETDMLPPFRMSSGATRNAKRAAVLLTKLTEEQDRKDCKVDARELSVKMFGCHFSLV